MDLFEQLRPLIADAVYIIVGFLVTIAVARFQQWTGMQIEGRHREALQSALANAARLAVAGERIEIREAIDYVARSVPDALAHFGAQSEGRIRDLLEPHIRRLRS